MHKPARELRVGDRLDQRARIDAVHISRNGRVLVRYAVAGSKRRGMHVYHADQKVGVR